MFEIKIIDSGYIMADGGAMFGAVPKRAWKHKYPSDENNLCPLVMRCVLAVSDRRRILIDTGMGDKHTHALTYYQPHKLINIEKSLSEFGYQAEDITDVVLTHLHFDHCGYATRKDKYGRITASFPNAKYWLSSQQWESYKSPNRLEADSLFADNIQPVYDEGLLHLIDKETDIFNGFSIKLFDGHTRGQLVPYILTKEGVCSFPGDLIPSSAHVPIEWISAYDICALTSAIEKVHFLEEAVEKDYTIIYCHDANVQMSKVKKLNNNYIACNPK